MFEDEIGYGIFAGLAFLCVVGWIAAFSFRNDIEDMVTDLPTGCILYEEKIWCEVKE